MRLIRMRSHIYRMTEGKMQRLQLPLSHINLATDIFLHRGEFNPVDTKFVLHPTIVRFSSCNLQERVLSKSFLLSYFVKILDLFKCNENSAIYSYLFYIVYKFPIVSEKIFTELVCILTFNVKLLSSKF